jgi:molybdopterin molybdotransferase
MPDYQEALKIILENTRTMQVEEKSLEECYGQVLAEDMFAEIDLPQTDTSGPDGYAVQSEDIKGASKDTPITLRILETVRAGNLPVGAVTPGTAIRIMTGAVVPKGADCVIRFEDTDEPGEKNGPNKKNPSQVKIFLSVEAGTNINKAGREMVKGTLVLAKGRSIGPAQLSALISAGKSTAKVFRRPTVAVLSTGDELINAGEKSVPGKTFNSNGPAVAALIRHYGGVARTLGTASDSEESLASRISMGIDADAIMISGGVSRGYFDLVRLVVARLGEVKFVRVNMVPGASFSFGLLHKADGKERNKSIPVFALAGPPSGCLLNFELLARPAILKMLGYSNLEHQSVDVTTAEDIPSKKMMFVKWVNLEHRNGDFQVIGKPVSMAKANAVELLTENTPVPAGGKIKVWPLDWNVEIRV